MEKSPATPPTGKIHGGFILLARKIWNGKIAVCPPHYREIWVYLLDAANHRDINHKGLVIKRGQCIRSYRDVIKGLGWRIGYRKKYYKKHQYDNAMRWFMNEHMVATTRTVRGTVISICNYDYYQSIENYEYCYDYRTPTAHLLPIYCTINKNEKNEKINTKYSFVENSIEFQLGKFLLEKIILRKPDFKKPDLQAWARHIDYTIRLDGRPPDEIKEVIVWCQRDSFWQNNILSPVKLRRQYDQLWLKMGKKKSSHTPTKELELKKAKTQKLHRRKAVNEYIKNMSAGELDEIKKEIYQKYVLGIIPDFDTAFSAVKKKKKLESYYESYLPIVIMEKLGISGCETIAKKVISND